MGTGKTVNEKNEKEYRDEAERYEGAVPETMWKQVRAICIES